MTTGNNHLIQKVTFELGLRDKDGAFEIQNRISDAFRSGILRQLEQLFDRFSTAGEVISIEKIEINVGDISSAHLDEELASSIEKELENFLLHVQNEILQARNGTGEVSISSRSSPNLQSRAITVRWPLPNNPHFEARITVANDSISWFDKVVYLLEHGIFPVAWTANESTRLPDLLNKIFHECPDQLVAFIRTKQNNDRIIQRLVLNARRDQLQYLASLLGCGFSYDLPVLIEELQSLFEERNIASRDFKRSNRFQFRKPEQFVWFWILHYYVLRQDQSQRSSIQSSDDKIQLVVRLILNEPLLLSRIFDVSAKSFSAAQADQWKTVAPAVDILARSILADPNSIWMQPRQRSATRNEKELSDLEVTPISPEEIRKALAGQQNTPELFRPLDQASIDEPVETDLGIYISNAGLILLAPYLKPFFANAGLMDGNKFVSVEAQQKAVHLLQHACGFESENAEAYTENDLVFNKILCGLDITEPVPELMELTPEDKEKVQELLKAILHNWTILRRSSIPALQRTFLQKPGKLSKSGQGWDLLVERDSAVEILIDKLPWSISLIKLPWNDYTISTQW